MENQIELTVKDITGTDNKPFYLCLLTYNKEEVCTLHIMIEDIPLFRIETMLPVGWCSYYSGLIDRNNDQILNFIKKGNTTRKLKLT